MLETLKMIKTKVDIEAHAVGQSASLQLTLFDFLHEKNTIINKNKTIVLLT